MTSSYQTNQQQYKFEAPAMTKNPGSDQMREAFDKARRAAEAKQLRDSDDWKRLRAVEERAEQLRRLAKERYKADFDKRIRAETIKLIDDRYRKNKDFKPDGAGDSNDVNRQADKNVRLRQEQRIMRIDRAEDTERDHVLKTARETRDKAPSFQRETTGKERAEMRRDFKRSR